MTHIIGIDVGLHGAIASMTLSGEDVEVIDMPIYKVKRGKRKKNHYDISRIVRILIDKNPEFAVLEKQQAMPKQGIVSMFNIGYGFGLFEGILSALAIPYEVVHPKKWQKEFGIRKGNTKVQSYEIASKLFPDVEIKGKRGGMKDGRADALLIAEFGRRKK